MFLCTDVHYDGDVAKTAALRFYQAADSVAAARYITTTTGVAAYEPGAFYKRELPCLKQVVELAITDEPVITVFVDGHTWLAEGEPGLGHYLYEAFDRQIAVVGVAKRAFRDGIAVPIVRGSSTSPLYVSAVGVDAAEAADFVAKMHGPHRQPTLFKAVDALCRGHAERPGLHPIVKTVE